MSSARPASASPAVHVALAAKVGIDEKAFTETVAQFNPTAPQVHDAAFGKGSKAYNRYQGDVMHGPNPCVAPLENGPFYAIKMVVGDLGTYAGIKTDEHARALDTIPRVPPPSADPVFGADGPLTRLWR